MRRQESHRGIGDGEVLARDRFPLGLVRVEERGRSVPAEDPGQLPGQVLGVGDARVQPTGAERRHDVRGVAREEDPTDAERIGQALAEAVGGHPDELVGRLGPDHLTDAPIEAAVRALGVGIGLGRDLPVDPPHPVGLGMDEHLPAGVPRRVQVEVALVREGKLRADIADQEAVVEAVPLEADAGGVANGRMGSIGADEVGGPMRQRAGIGLEGRRDALGVLGQRGEAVATVDANAQRGRARLEELLDLGLADVHERREVLVVAREMDLEQLAAAEVGPPDVPLDAAVGDGLADPEPSPDLEGLALHADRLRAEALASRLGLEQVDADAVLGQASGQRQADRTGTDDRDVRHRRA